MFDDIDFTPGIVTYDGTKFLDQEDIFQVAYREDSYTLDVGWYRKVFKVVVINNLDWEKPALEKRCTNPDQLYELVQECVDFIRKRLEMDPNS
ncbi:MULTISPECIES: hypothetical protein [unclassified Paenibacillus]|uniref:hypothetical protein n=1 Tax=unclassified Paenibacillus TaxID=185978 RepID=UPI002404956D|nr:MULTISPECIES: hypothetical protein [unclassified Paenibacillus]MDF9840419.1 hypothetical protein [Paenibacillus sp. PastF-2]MDF9847001.1 hypothetical protein [Paenibacillus sp. PastM-2]MDF9853573.1 hypothetical protein [Paenibacillus sp. PastF-1]MDH6478941.1 hypothetical protein [Paenibacillus sp. PastH-2]MDH6506673.1 hypothetical protein [Paenibacillus sp. PastM-3]